MGDWVDELGFLARSENRVRLFRAVAAAQPCGRRILQSATDASRVTLSRALRGLESQGWIRRGATGYETTPLGDAVLDDLDRLEGTMRLSTKLGPVVEYVPFECFDFDVRRLANAEVVTPTPTHPLAPVTRADELMREASEVKILAETVTNSTVNSQREAAEAGQRAEIVLSDDLFGTMTTDDRLAESFRALLRSGPVSAFHYGGDVPLTLGVYDGTTVGYGVVDEEGFPRAVIVSDDPVVVEQMDGLICEYREASTPLSPDTFGD
jgi:predicted transcriptional regulator